MDNISDFQESIELELGKTLLATEEYVLLTFIAEQVDKNDDYRVKQDLFRSAEDKLSVLFLSKWELFSERAELGMYSILLDM